MSDPLTETAAPSAAAPAPDDPPPSAWRLRRFARRAKRALRRAVTRTLMWLACALIPRAYVAYMRLVWATSRVRDLGISRILDLAEKHDGVVGVVWHEEVFSVAWAYRRFAPHTLASTGDAGEVITRLLLRCGFTVFRGGSGAKSRRREQVLADMIAHMKETPRVIYGITVDGSNGPAYKLKRGAVAIASECRKPIAVVRTWAKRNLRLPTWDRMAIPLPFNVIHQYLEGPFYPPPDVATDPAAFEVFRQQVEDELLRLRDRAHRELGTR